MTLDRSRGYRPGSGTSFGETLRARRLLRVLVAAAWAFVSEIILIAVSPAAVIVLAYAAAITVAIFHGTEDGLSYTVWLAVGAAGLVALPFIWLMAAIGIALGIRRTLDVPLLAPLFGAIAAPTLIIALLVTDNVDTAIAVVLALRDLLGYDD